MSDTDLGVSLRHAGAVFGFFPPKDSNPKEHMSKAVKMRNSRTLPESDLPHGELLNLLFFFLKTDLTVPLEKDHIQT